MATIIPRIPTDYHGSPGEKEAVLALRHLPADYVVYHSIRWVSEHADSTQGEADLVVFHPKKGWLVFEVKSGGIRCEDGLWFQTNRATEQEKNISDPAGQAERNRFNLAKKLGPFIPPGEDCLHGHGVWFTSIDKAGFRYPPNYLPQIVLDRGDLVRPETAMERVFAF